MRWGIITGIDRRSVNELVRESSMWKDWCPLCGMRFIAVTVEDLVALIIHHLDDGICENHFQPLQAALGDDHF